MRLASAPVGHGRHRATSLSPSEGSPALAGGTTKSEMARRSSHGGIPAAMVSDMPLTSRGPVRTCARARYPGQGGGLRGHSPHRRGRLVYGGALVLRRELPQLGQFPVDGDEGLRTDSTERPAVPLLSKSRSGPDVDDELPQAGDEDR
jgi:hypothetical protein